MANINAPFGLRPIRHLKGGEARFAAPYTIASDYATKIYRGDVVEMTGTGRNIAQAAAENVDNIGVFAGCRFKWQGKYHWANYWPANTAYTDVEAYVYDDPGIVFEVQADSIAAADVGALCDWAVGTGDDVFERSGLYATASTTGTTGKALRILGLRSDQSYAAYGNIEVVFAEHALATGAAGAGGV